MEFEQRADQRFQDFLEGRSAPASPELAKLASIVSALRPTISPGPDHAFRRRLRSELIAQASTTEEDIFAAIVEGAPVEAPRDLRPLVAVASSLRSDALPSPSPAFRYRLRNTLIEQATARPTLRGRATAWVGGLERALHRRTRFVAALGMAMMMMLGTGVVFAAASNSYPGDALYGVKRLHENIRIAVLSGQAEGRAHLTFARERVTELWGLRDRGESENALYLSTLDSMDRSTTSGTKILLDVFERTGDRAAVEYVSDFASQQIHDLTGLVETLPPGVRPAARDSLQLAHRTAEQAELTLIGCSVCPDDPLLTTPTAKARGRAVQQPGCACPQEAPQQDSPSRPPRGDTEGPDEPGPTPPPPPAVDLPDDLPDDVEDPSEDLLDELVDVINEPLPEIPGLPSEIPSLDDLGL
jgi:hypothetical protein